MGVLAEQGVLLESARGPIPNVAELVAGEPIKGSWWGHPSGHAIFAAINELAESPDVVRVRAVNGKITLVHRRLWPALTRIGTRFPPGRLASVTEEHTDSGARPQGRNSVSRLGATGSHGSCAAALTEDEALAMLPECLRARRRFGAPVPSGRCRRRSARG